MWCDVPEAETRLTNRLSSHLRAAAVRDHRKIPGGILMSRQHDSQGAVPDLITRILPEFQREQSDRDVLV